MRYYRLSAGGLFRVVEFLPEALRGLRRCGNGGANFVFAFAACVSSECSFCSLCGILLPLATGFFIAKFSFQVLRFCRWQTCACHIVRTFTANHLFRVAANRGTIEERINAEEIKKETPYADDADRIGGKTGQTDAAGRRIHAPALYAAAQNPDIWTYMPIRITRWPKWTSIERALAAKAQGTEYPFVIVDQEAGRIVGSTRFLDIQPQNRNLEIGWTWHSPDVWRTHINTECKYLLLRYCFETLTRCAYS